MFRPQCIYERDDLAVREKEGMEQRKGCVYGAVPPELIIREHDALMAVDIENGQKTGHFLDQQENRGHLRPYSRRADGAGPVLPYGRLLHPRGTVRRGAGAGRGRLGRRPLPWCAGTLRATAWPHRVETVCANVFDLVRQDYARRADSSALSSATRPPLPRAASALDGAYRGYQ